MAVAQRTEYEGGFYARVVNIASNVSTAVQKSDWCPVADVDWAAGLAIRFDWVGGAASGLVCALEGAITSNPDTETITNPVFEDGAGWTYDPGADAVEMLRLGVFTASSVYAALVIPGLRYIRVSFNPTGNPGSASSLIIDILGSLRVRQDD